MIPYASRTGTKRNLSALRRAGWRLLVSARGPLRPEGFPYALDNGAWTAHQQGTPFDSRAFVDAVDRLGQGADWIVVPDIVGGGRRSLDFSLSWLPRLRGMAPLLLAVQDGMRGRDIEPLVGPELGIAVGGSTRWKLSTLRYWGAMAQRTGAYLHVLRVNTARRIRLCQDAGAHSFDGTSASRFAATVPLLDNARRQLPLWRSLV